MGGATKCNDTPGRPQAEAHTVLHVQRLPAGWTRQHIADRFLWLEGVVGVAEAHSAGEVHGYLTFLTHR